MIVVDPDNIAVLVVGDNGFGELLVHALVLYEAAAFVHYFRLGGVWDGIVETGP